jgi:hypothetical protein
MFLKQKRFHCCCLYFRITKNRNTQAVFVVACVWIVLFDS